ncbi:MAG: hypothetical protein U0174_05360 [Polyangiaceae bacterium]
MRGYLQGALKIAPNETQTEFASLSRTRRSKLAAAAQTTLVKADQWARGEAIAPEVASALEKGVTGRKKTAAKK